MADFLLELFSEEIPARMQKAAASQLAERFSALLAEAGLEAERIEASATPRRLVLLAEGLPDASAATREERRGPRADAPEQALQGFLKSTGLTREQLEEREDPKGRFLYAVVERAGQPTADILAQRLPAMIGAINWPKSQRWGSGSVRWVRPLRKIVALLDRELVPFEALGVQSGRDTHGHRFMGGGEPIAIDSARSHEDQLKSAFVILSPAEREDIIAEGAARAAEAAGWHLRPDPGLVAENAGLTEWPVPLLGRFDPAYLHVPPEIIQLTMRTNQKYFAVEDEAGSLAPGFVCVANLLAADDGATIIAGNERVLGARLADARFFWEQDRAKRLEDHAARLGDIVFQERLGTMAEKVERVARLARWIAERQFPGIDPALVERAGRLARADLTTGTVGEFPELQGVIGGHLATAQGEDPAVAAALHQHYLPLPQGDAAVAVAMADRLDTLAGFFLIRELPTGSRDPFALRRAALEVASNILENRLRLPLRDVLGAAVQAYDGQASLSGDVAPAAQVVEDIIRLIVERLRIRQKGRGVRYDLLDAVCRLNERQELEDDDLLRIMEKLSALQTLVESDDGANLLAGYKRAVNILRIEEKKDGRSYEAKIDPSLLAEPSERALADVLAATSSAVNERIAAQDFVGAMTAISALRVPVDRFFDDVTVNAGDQALRANRLALLAALRDTAHLVADFGKVEG